MNTLIIGLSVFIFILFCIIIFLVFKLRSDKSSVQYSQDHTIDMDAVVEDAPQPFAAPDTTSIIQEYIDAGRYPQAVGLLNKAISNEPNQSHLRLMLLDVLAKQNDVEQFEQAVDELHALNDPHAIQQANQIRSTMMPSANELPLDDMLAQQTAPVQKSPAHTDVASKDDGMIDFSPQQPVTLEDATTEIAAVDFDFEQTPDDQLEQLENEITSAHISAVNQSGIQERADVTEEVTFDFSDNDSTSSSDTNISANELEFDNLELSSQQDTALPELSVSSEPKLSALADSSDMPTLDMNALVEPSGASDLPSLDSPAPTTQPIASDTVPADAVATTNEFTFDIDTLSDGVADEAAQSIDDALTSDTPVSLPASTEETGTFNFDKELLLDDTADNTGNDISSSPQSLGASSLPTRDDAGIPSLAVAETATQLTTSSTDSLLDTASLSAAEPEPLAELNFNDGLSLDMDDSQPDTVASGLSLATSDSFDFDTETQSASPHDSDALSLDMGDSLALQTDADPISLVPSNNDVVAKPTKPHDAIAQLDAIFMGDVSATVAEKTPSDVADEVPLTFDAPSTISADAEPALLSEPALSEPALIETAPKPKLQLDTTELSLADDAPASIPTDTALDSLSLDTGLNIDSDSHSDSGAAVNAQIDTVPTMSLDTGASIDTAMPDISPLADTMATPSVLDTPTDPLTDSLSVAAPNTPDTSLSLSTDESADALVSNTSPTAELNLSNDDFSFDDTPDVTHTDTAVDSAAATTSDVPVQPASAPAVEPATIDPGASDLLNQLKAEFGFVETQDANQTNLELASRYIHLGEYNSAKSLLNEVLTAGTIEQQGEARQLIEKINI